MLRRALFTIALLTAPAALGAQQPTVSPFVERALSRDTTLTIWLFVRPERSLAEVTALVGQVGGRVRRESRWLHAVSANVTTGALQTLRRRAELERIQPVARFVSRPEPPILAAPAFGLAPVADDFGPSVMPIRRLNVLPLVNRGFRGQGVKIAILDTGFETGLPVFATTTVIAQRDFINNDGVVRNEAGDPGGQSSHGTSTWSLIGANQQGTIVGVAPNAEYILAKTEDTSREVRTEEDDYVAALEWADSLGANIVSSSLGYFAFDGGFSYTKSQLNGDFAVTTIAVDIAAQRGITVVTSAGNSGPGAQTLGTPADADSAIAVGAVDSLGSLVAFSSRGPTADGRIKPDVTAPGFAVWVASAGGGFGRANGTSFSAPLTAGAAALLKQIHPAFGPIDIRNALRSAGTNSRTPDSDRGWGTPDVAAAATFPRGIVIQSPTDTALTSVTPSFSWSTPDVPAFGLPVQYRFTAARDAELTAVILDTTLTGSSVSLLNPQQPSPLFFRITATGADTVSLSFNSGALSVPAWARLETLNNVGNAAIRSTQPSFSWSSPPVTPPAGPFTYNVRIFRANNGMTEIEARDIGATTLVPPRPLAYNIEYRWLVTAKLGNDSSTTVSPGTFTVVEDNLPSVTLLFQSFPNPFPDRGTGRRSACIWFDLATAGTVRLDILDQRGHLVRNLVPGSTFDTDLPAGHYGRSGPDCDPALEWNGLSAGGVVAPQGIYLARLTTPDGTFFRRMVFLGPGF